MKGYKEPRNVLTKEEICTVIHTGWSQDACRFFASFDKITGKMCGYADVYERGLFLPISSMHSMVEYERKGVNLALIAGIVEWYVQLEKQGAYLCDGARNVVHETNFQDFLIKYFGFRKAYCKLHIVYRPIVNVVVLVLFPFRHILAKVNNSKVKNVCAVLKMEAWKRGLPE